MALRIEFRSGDDQAWSANAYFTDMAVEQLEELLTADSVCHAILYIRRKVNLAVRLWSDDDWFNGKPAPELFTWLVRLNEAAVALHEEPNDSNVESLMKEWVPKAPWEGSYMVEQFADPAHLFSGASPQLRVVIVNGRISILSTDLLMGIELGSDLYGLAVVGEGSYLIES